MSTMHSTYTQKYKVFFQKKTVRQFAYLFSVNVISLPLSLLTSIVITRYLGAQLYGDYKFVNSLFNVAIIICNFGFFHAGNRALLLSKDRVKSREYYASILIITGILSFLMCIGLLFYAVFDSNIESKKILIPFLCVLPFGFVYLVNYCYETLLQADNQIHYLSIVRLVPKLGYLLGGIGALFYLKDFSLNKLLVVCYIYILTQFAVYVYVIFKLKPIFKNVRERIRELVQYNRDYGFDVYIGALCAVGFASLTDVLISYFGADNTGVGFYSLALTFASPLLMIPSTMATTKYRDFSNQDKIPCRLIATTVGLSFLVMFCLWIAVPPFINLFYGNDFHSVIRLNQYICFGVLMHGLADFFNRFIAAKGKGKLLRNGSFIVGLATLGLNILMIPKFGANGAAYAKMLSGLVYLIVIYICYRLVLKAG